MEAGGAVVGKDMPGRVLRAIEAPRAHRGRQRWSVLENRGVIAVEGREAL